MDSGSRGMGAHCAIHPTMGATGTCERCGNFMCDVCSERGAQTLCPGCRERVGHSVFPLRRDTWSFSALWDYCFEAFKRDWLMLSVSMLVVMAVSMVANFIGNVAGPLVQKEGSLAPFIIVSIIAAIVQMVVQGVMGLGMLRVVFDVLEGGKADVGRLFSQFHKVGRYLLALLLGVLVVALPLMILFAGLSFVGLVAVGHSVGDIVGGQVFRSPDAPLALAGVLFGASLLTFIPAIYFGLPLYLLQPELVFNEDVSAVDALRNCYVLARGERLSILGVSFVAGMVGMVGLLACCVGVIPAIALGQLLIGGLYLSLRGGSELEERRG